MANLNLSLRLMSKLPNLDFLLRFTGVVAKIEQLNLQSPNFETLLRFFPRCSSRPFNTQRPQHRRWTINAPPGTVVEVDLTQESSDDDAEVQVKVN
jgi:hypothetical protein